METTLFYVLLGTGLREPEVVSLKVGQYRQKGLYDVMRHKSKRFSRKIPLPQESRVYLDQYLRSRNASEDEPFFITRYGMRLQTLDVYRICKRLLKQALAFLPEAEKFEFTPHKLRHTFLKKVTDKHGVHFAQELSGNISIKEIFRYAKPSQEEMQETIDELFA
ncbi:tyrosine-type recombinase/integrase [Legionella qingyii]|nr:tyrosine-type recombinase/integrase [Legionella qingyii]